MPADVAISVRKVSKHYQIYQRPEDRLKQAIVPRLQRLLGRPQSCYFHDFTALRDVSFDVLRGQVVGIVGRNGSGKSTLLQIICGTTRPSAGEVAINGRIAALLELGAGFNPEFTGRENIYMNAAILGMSASEIDERFNDIVAFADIGDFLDQPVKTYSSGMYLRLAFAVAINVDPDILVIDEALAVGDAAFQRKCFARIEQLRELGTTILLVSHSTRTILELCERALLLDAGEILMNGPAKDVMFHYQRLLDAQPEQQAAIREAIRHASVAPEDAAGVAGKATNPAPSPPPSEAPPAGENFDQQAKAYDVDGAEIVRVRLVDVNGQEVKTLQAGEEYALVYTVRFLEDLREIGFSATIWTVSGLVISGVAGAAKKDTRIRRVVRGQVAEVRFPFRCLLTEGPYFISCGVVSRTDGQRRVLHRVVDALMFKVIDTQKKANLGFVDLGMLPQWRIVSSADAACADQSAPASGNDQESDSPSISSNISR